MSRDQGVTNNNANLKDLEVGTEVRLYGVVARQTPGQTLILFTSTSDSEIRSWSVVNSVEAEVSRTPTSVGRRFVEWALGKMQEKG